MACSYRKLLLLREFAALAIGLSPLEKGLKKGLKGLSSMPRPCWTCGEKGYSCSKGLAKGLAICPSFWV